MITLTKNGNAIVFTFSDNAHYLFDGTIEVPVNSLTLITDNSQMATFKKSASNDIFISATYAELGMSKSELESWFKENACGSTGGGGVTSGEVETMIETSLEDYYDIDEVDAALSAKANTATTYTKTEVDNALANKADTATTYTKTEVDNAITAATSTKQDTLIAGSGITISGNVISSEGGNKVVELTQAQYDALVDKDPDTFYIITDAEAIDINNYYTKTEVNTALSAKANTATTYTKTEVDNALANKADTSAVTEAISSAVSGKVNTSAYNTYTAATDSRLAEDEEVTAAGLNALNDALGDKADTSAVTASIAAAVSGKQDTLIAGSGITISGNVISSEGGGGKAIVAGTNISVTTGATADTVNCTLPFIIKSNGIAYNNSYGNIIIGNNNFDGANSIFTRGNNTGSYRNLDIIIAGGSNKFTGAAQQMLIAGSSNEIKNTSEGYSSAGGNGIIVGQGNKINYSRHNYVFGDYNTGGTSGTTQQEYNNYLLVFGEHNKTNNNVESTFGKYNNSVSGSSTFGDSGNTLFSVGNGTSNSARHNAFEIRQNGDIYFPDTDNTTYQNFYEKPMVRLQDMYGALGGLKLVKLTQAAYDQLATKDPNTLYVIVD